MKLLHVKHLRTILIAASICIFGFLLSYLSGGLLISDPVESPNVPTAELEVENEKTEEPPEATPEETPAEEPDNSSAANYYIRLTRGLSSSEEELVLEAPSQLKASVEYRSKEINSTLTAEEEIAEILTLIQNAKRLPDDTKIVSMSSSHDVTLTLPYTDGFGNLYIFEGYPNGANKTVTLIQDNSNHLYQAKADVANKLYDLLKPVETSLEAERLNVYSTRDYDKSILQAQSTNKEDFTLIVDVLNSLEKSGSSLDLDSPDYLITLLPSNSVAEKDYCYLWLDEKELKIAFADDSITVYRSTDVTSSQMKKWIKENSVK